MGQLRKRGGVWWIRYYRAGRRFEESARTGKHEEARELLKRIEGDIAKGVPVTSAVGRLRFPRRALVPVSASPGARGRLAQCRYAADWASD